jgi:hypothetical protein
MLVCGLVARERVLINGKLESITMEIKETDLFTIIEDKLEYHRIYPERIIRSQLG